MQHHVDSSGKRNGAALLFKAIRFVPELLFRKYRQSIGIQIGQRNAKSFLNLLVLFLWPCLALGAPVIDGKKLLLASSDKKASFLE